MRTLAAVLGLALIGVLAAPAAAQNAVSIGFSTGPGAGATADRTLPVSTTGVVSVDFHGEPAAGCAQAGVCGVSGNETWDPGGRGLLEVFLQGDTPIGGSLLFELGPGGGGRTTARVSRREADGTAGACGDVVSGSGDSELGSAPGGLAVALFGTGSFDFGASSMMGTRCAGPIDADLRDLLPVRRLTAAQLEAGHTSVDLSADRPFSGHGFSGAVHSSVMLTVGAPLREVPLRLPHGVRARRYKLAVAHFAVESATGRVGLRFGGLAEPDLCDALDACGLTGTITLSNAAKGGSAELATFGSGRSSRRRLLAKLGLITGRVKPAASGFAAWNGGAALADESSRSGVPACRGDAAVGGGSLQLEEHGDKLRAEYRVGFGEGSDALHTRCPGPSGGDLKDGGVLVSGELPLRLLHRRRFAIHLRRGGTLSGQGYSGGTSGDLTVVLERRRVRVTPFSVPAPERGQGFTEFIDEIVATAAG